jgi:transcriptional regulator with PAS, ATPase and Fis domain
MQEFYTRIDRIAQSDAPVIISGESGTGKELAARALHAESHRSDEPFVPVNCAGIQESLLESEFFGHTSGAFTGAEEAREGLFQEADGGTIFLDEFTELPMSLQAKLLRALQEDEVRPVGSNRAQTIDVRVVAATNRDVSDAHLGDTLREDFYYRLSTFTLEVPPLRERSGDIARLSSYFLNESDTASRNDIEGMTEQALDCLNSYDFPGNVRELENTLERAIVFCDGDLIERSHLPSECRQSQKRRVTVDQPRGGSETHLRVADEEGDFATMDELKQQYARHVLERVDENKRQAADVLDIGRRTLYRYLDAD